MSPQCSISVKQKLPVDFHAKLEADLTYHIYNRTNNKELLFKDDFDRRYFLKKYKFYCAPFLKTFAYALLANHFHFLIQVRSKEIIYKTINALPPLSRTKAQAKFLELEQEDQLVFEVLERAFTQLFTSYSLYFNKRYNRKGNLFYRRFKRVEVVNETQLMRLIFYIHFNPQHHKVIKDYKNYKWISYHAYLSENNTTIERDYILHWLGGKEAFINLHNPEIDFGAIKNILIE